MNIVDGGNFLTCYLRSMRSTYVVKTIRMKQPNRAGLIRVRKGIWKEQVAAGGDGGSGQVCL